MSLGLEFDPQGEVVIALPPYTLLFILLHSYYH